MRAASTPTPNGTTDINLTGGAVHVATGGTAVDCANLCIGAPSLGVPPGPDPGQPLNPGPRGGTLTIKGGSIVIDQTEQADTIILIAHGRGTVSGHISEVTGGKIIAATALEGAALSNNGTVLPASVDLSLAGANTIASLGSFSVTSTVGSVVTPVGDFNLANVGSISVAGPVTAGNVTISAESGPLSTGSIAVPGIINAGTLVSLFGRGGITESGSINAGTVAANTGTVALSTRSRRRNLAFWQRDCRNADRIVRWGVRDRQTAGLLNAGTIGTLSLAVAGTLSTPAPDAVTQGPNGTIVAGTLVSNGGPIGGNVRLLGTHNAIATLGSNTTVGAVTTIGTLAATGDIQIRDTSALTIADGALVQSSTGNVYLQSSNAGGITFGASGTVAALGPNATVGLQTDRLTNLGTTGATGVVLTNAGTFELAPNTIPTTVTLGTNGASLSLSTLDGITAQRVRIGAVTAPGAVDPITLISAAPTLVTTATAITVAAPFDAAATHVLELDALGDVSQSAPLLNVGTLTGAATNFSLTNPLNTIGTIGLPTVGPLGSLRATGSIDIVDSVALTIAGDAVAGYTTGSAAAVANLTVNVLNSQPLTINGEAVSVAGDVVLAADTITLAQVGLVVPVVKAEGTAELTAVTVSQTAGIINAGTVAITATDSVTLANGLVVATQGSVGFTSLLSPRNLVVSISGTETIAAANQSPGIHFSGNVDQSDPSAIGSNGTVFVGGVLTQFGGLLHAAGGVSFGGLAQHAGLIEVGALNIGSGTGIAGRAGSVATSGSFGQAGGTVIAQGPVNIFTTGLFLQTGGTLAAGGTLGATAQLGIDIAGTVAAAGAPSGFMLLANGGDAILRTGGLLGGPALTVNGNTIPGNAVQAPAGTVQINGTTGAFGLASVSGSFGPISYTLTCPGCVLGSQLSNPAITIPTGLSAHVTAGGRAIPAALIGGTVDIEGLLSASTLGLYAKSLIQQGVSGAIDADMLTGSAGVLRSGVLAPGLTALGWTDAATIGWATGSLDTVGSVDLSHSTAANTITTLSDFAATGDFSLADANAQGLVQRGTLQAGSALADSTAAATVATTLSVTGPLTINGTIATGIDDNSVRPGGNTSISATGSLTVAGTVAAVPAGGVGGALSLSAGTTLAQTGGLINGGSVSLSAPGGATLSNGTIVATTGTIGIDTTSATVSAAEIIAALNTATGVTFSGDLQQNAGTYIGSNGSVAVAGRLTEQGGTLLAAGNVAAGSLSQTGGTIASGAAITIGSGTGIAGVAGSSATGGTFSQSAGVLLAAGDANIFTTGSFTQGGVLATGGTLGVTANQGIAISGTVSAAGAPTGFRLLATNGNAVVSPTGLLAGPALPVTGDTIPGNALQAPAGTVQIGAGGGTRAFGRAGAVSGIIPVSGYKLTPPINANQVPRLSAPAFAAAVDGAATPVRLIGNAIDIERPVTASILELAAATSITEAAAITAGRLTGRSGTDVNLLQPGNDIASLGAFDDAGHGFFLVDGSNLALAGVVTAELGPHQGFRPHHRPRGRRRSGRRRTGGRQPASGRAVPAESGPFVPLTASGRRLSAGVEHHDLGEPHGVRQSDHRLDVRPGRQRQCRVRRRLAGVFPPARGEAVPRPRHRNRIRPDRRRGTAGALHHSQHRDDQPDRANRRADRFARRRGRNDHTQAGEQLPDQRLSDFVGQLHQVHRTDGPRGQSAARRAVRPHARAIRHRCHAARRRRTGLLRCPLFQPRWSAP